MTLSSSPNPSPTANEWKTITEMEAMMESVRAQMATLESMIAKEKDAQGMKSEYRSENNEADTNDVEDKDGSQQDTSSVDEENCELSSQEVKQILFEGSTHRFLYLNTIREDGKEYRVGLGDKFIAAGVLAIQFFSYYLLLWMIRARNKAEDIIPESSPLKINSEFCWGETLMDSYRADELSTHDSMLQNLKCGDWKNGRTEPIYAFLPGIILLVCFVLQDIFEALALSKCRGRKAKITATIIIQLALLPIYVAIYGTIQAVNGAFDTLDTYLLIVGSIFVHDVDEQIGHWKAVERRLGQTFKWLEIQFWFCILLLFGILLCVQSIVLT